MKRSIVLCVVLSVLLGGVALAKKPDGEPHGRKAGICRDLKYATPGLYGLCVAFCEARQCRPDFSLDNPFEDCRPSSARLLESTALAIQRFSLRGVATFATSLAFVHEMRPCATELRKAGSRSSASASRMNCEVLLCEKPSDSPAYRCMDE